MKGLKRISTLAAALLLVACCSGCSNEKEQGQLPSSSSESSVLFDPPDPGGAGPLPPYRQTAAETTKFDDLDTAKQGWGQGVQFDEQNRPTSCTSYQELYGKYNAVFLGEGAKNFYLTFDEGYENGYTAQILDTLKEKQVPAVFFITYDYAQSEPELVQRMIDEGHVVGNHSYTHPSMPTLSVEEQTQEITQLHDYIKQEFGYEMTLFRPPMGEFSEQSLAVAQSLGYKSVFWSFAYKDWDKDNQPDVAASLTKTVERAHPGAVYLLHAVSSTNANILGQMIDEIKAQGYTFKALA